MRRLWAVPTLAFALLLSSCSSNGPASSGNMSGSGSATILSGFVVDDFVSGASISAYQVTSTGAAGALIAGPVTTSSTGAYTLSLGSYTGPVLLQSTGGTYTDSATGTTVNLAGSGLTLTALVPDASGATTTEVTPLTMLATQIAMTLMSQGTDPATASTEANTAIGSFFDISNILTTALVDLTKSGCATGASQVSIDESYILAGISELAKTYGVTTYNLIIALGSDMGPDFLFDGTSSGTAITVPLIAGGTIPLSTIEAGGATLVASGGVPGLASAISAFEGSGSDACGAPPSSSLGPAISAPPGKSPPGIGSTIQVPMVVLGSLTAPTKLKFEIILTSSAAGSGAGYTNVNQSITSGGTYFLVTTYPASSFSGSMTVSVAAAPAGETCGLQLSVGGTSSSAQFLSFNTSTLIANTLYLDCSLNTYSLGGSVSGLTAGTVGIKNNTTGVSTSVTGSTTTGGGAFTLDTGLPYNSSFTYNVSLTQPTSGGETCAFTGGATTSAATVTVTGAISLPYIVCTSPSSTGTGTTTLNNPNGLAFDCSGNLYVANSGGNDVIEYSEQTGSGNVPTGLTPINTITAGVSSPSRLAFDSACHYLYVANLGSNSVTVYDATNNFSQVTTGTITNGVSRPLALAVDGSGNVYVGNNTANSLTVYSGSPTAGFGSPTTLTSDHAGNAFSAPGAMVYNNLGGSSGSGILLVGLGPSFGADLVLSYTPPLSSSSSPTGTLSNSGCSTGPSGPTAVAIRYVPAFPEVFVASFYNSSVSEFSLSQLTSGGCPTPLATSIGNTGSAIAQPEGLAVDSLGYIFVSNSSANDITAYALLTSAPLFTRR